MNQQSDKVFPFTKICAGQPYRICTTDGDFDRFIYEIDDEEQLIISRSADATQIERVPILYDVKVELVQGVIKTSLFDAVTELGEDTKLAIALADLFAWDIDFILDLRVGDTFQALVEKRFREGEPAGYGKVFAAEFINRHFPLDLREASFPIGSVASSATHHVGVTLWHSADGYELFIPRGFSLSLWEGLVESAEQFGVDIA